MEIENEFSLPGGLPVQPFASATPGSVDKGNVLQEFESLFLTTLLKQARQARKSNEGLIPRSPGRDAIEDMFDSMMAQELSRQGGMGLAEVLRAQLGLETENQSELNANPQDETERSSGEDDDDSVL